MTRFSLPLALALGAAAGGCGEAARTDDAPLAVSVIGGPAAPADPSRGALDSPARVLLAETAQGLVRFDASGQIVPGLAERWNVIDEGRTYIFRLREAEWSDGKPVTAGEVVRVLRRAAADDSRNSLAPFLAVIEEFVAMTPQVIEVRLRRPRPDLLKLFAQPEMAVFRTGFAGSGPFRARPATANGVLLSPAPDPVQIPGDAPTPGDRGNVRLRGERAALAIARYAEERTDLVLGGSFADWPLLAAAGIAPEAARFDPVAGLFGFAIVARDGFLADPANRAALAMAIDRAAVTTAFRSDWAPVETLLPEQFDSQAAPALPGWAPLPLEARRENARSRVRAWRAAHPEPLVVRIALPAGPGATLLWAEVARSMLAIGAAPRRVGANEDAELRLVDAVAPYDSARWYLVNACRLCNDDVVTLIAAARDAPTLDARARRLAEADAALTADASYIPIARPLRWALVTHRISGWQGNTRGWHPLTELRNEAE